MTVFKICGICLCAAILFMILKTMKSDAAVCTVIGGIIAVLIALLPEIGELLGVIEKFGVSAKTVECIGVMLKALGVAYVAGTVSDICKEAGSSTLASNIETAAKIEIVALALPYVYELVTLAVRMAK